MSTRHRFPLAHLRDVVVRTTRHLAASPPLPPQADDSVAVLIDGENIGPELLPQILAEACRYDAPRVRYLYGHAARPAIPSWQPSAQHYGIELRHQESLNGNGKNAADLALAVDALSIHYERGVARFCLASDDADYAPLIARLRQRGCLVVVLGRLTAARALQTGATSFVALTTAQASPAPRTSPTQGAPREQVAAQIDKPALPRKKTTQASARGRASALAQPEPDPLYALVARALAQADVTDIAWVRLNQLGQYLKQADPTFSVSQYGYKQLGALVRARADLFAIHEEHNAGAGMLVRLRVQP
jgi:hypothetical protein